jgi:hypothetical protein
MSQENFDLLRSSSSAANSVLVRAERISIRTIGVIRIRSARTACCTSEAKLLRYAGDPPPGRGVGDERGVATQQLAGARCP